ncbi:DEAD/DEAH box helicase [Pseudoalteromonas sp. SR44-5]|jgi:ATP-dependent RNA helicase DeaD|uniref:ATP-dependent RNA helicase DeaD n=2 Tax=Pseudoalteromonas TaxID=53246 RepID=A0ABY3FAL6_9GAMM|nr:MULTISPECIES: DEAD/DEAH box helicase [Pseudoalteromonas]MBB1293749.1 DEAD/DEAH box helicase [Pseudoalteromonas sp. SR41-4]MBB1301221.1 DEAD/DEAH box helicase [Pseudoalteromonas sp. SR44-8]MBB1310970.1 DEAD/DEAH box helicase [Pseudoalteromonas sp. SR41-8]MBB1334460.1 DEAD/DEAH box helicase [Pseudoalteromonas sp. SR41-6]MBB1342391.1 DEAD/DEAH box helicase [Pseudoalteromonas sp. SR45-6]|tara:strand:+ start:3431 stop:5278 length:1848 start_codon:yes stop_codon:yes gene_type:complete
MSEPVTFESLNLSPAILKAVEELGYKTPSEIQAQCIPLLLERKDVLGLAQTGTGKTAAFALPLLNNIDPSVKQPQILVLTPTRELAIQVAEAFEQYAKHVRGIEVLALYGGQSYSIQLSALRRGAQVIVATPGRLIDHINRGTIKFDSLQALVLDEADEMLRMGFIDDVENIMEKTPREKQTCLFSATMPKQIQNISSKYMNNPEQVHISARNSTVSSVEQVFWNASVHKNKAIVRFLEAEQYEGAIVFVRTRNDTVQLAELLEREGFSAAPLNGDMNQQARERTVERLKSGMLNVVIATDVAARGLDVDRLSLVINYDIPQDSEAYVHRIGRTGRAGRTGKAILFVKHNERYLLKNIIRHTNSDIVQVELPTAKVVEEKRIEALQAKLAIALENKDITFFNEVAANMAQKLELAPEDLAGALLCLAQQQSPIKVEEVKIQQRERSERNDRNPRERNDRGDRGRRNERSERPARDRDAKPRERNSRDAGPMDTYRIEVGREHGVQVKNIVGAIANEADISSKFIGDIRLHDNHSTVQLPQNMPKDVLDHFQKVFICKRPMGLTLTQDQGPAEPRAERSERPSGDKKRSFNKDDSARGDKRSGPRKERRPVSFTAK